MKLTSKSVHLVHDLIYLPFAGDFDLFAAISRKKSETFARPV